MATSAIKQRPRRPGTPRTCIYCKQSKPPKEFRAAEHVMPRQVGTYEQNFTLRCVCTDCNHYFGRELEDQFARDSIEVLDAVKHGIRTPDRYRSAGRRGTLRGRVEDGPFENSEVYFKPGAKGSSQLVVDHVEGVAFAPTENGPWTWRRLDDLPEPSELAALWKDELEGKHAFVRIPPNGNPVKVRDALVAKGYTGAEFGEQVFETRTEIQIEAITTIGRPTHRLACKVALNYLAHRFDARTALVAEFDAVREFVRFDRGERKDFIELDLEPILDKRYVLNVVVLRLGDRGAHAQVSFLGRIRYKVALSRERFGILAASGHVFDPFNRLIMPLEHRPVAVPMKLYPVRG